MAELKAIAEKASSPAKTAQSQGATYTGGLSQERFTQLKNIAQSAPTVRTQAPSAPQDKSSFFKKASSAIGNLGIGALKEAGSTISSIGELGAKALSPIDRLTGAKPIQSGDTERALNTVTGSQNSLTPTNTAQKIGFGATQIGEFFIPAGFAGKAVKAAESGINASKVGKLAAGAARSLGLERAGAKTAAEFATGLSKLASTSAIEGTIGAGTMAAQGGSKEDIRNVGIISAAFPIFSRAIASILEKVPETAWSAILKRSPIEAAKNPELPAQAAKAGLLSTTRTGLIEQAKRGVQAIEVTLDDILSKTEEKVSGSKVANYLDELSSAYSGIPGEQSSVSAIQEIANSVRALGEMTAKQANNLKRDIYSLISKTYGKGMLEIPAKREAQKLVAYGLKKEIEAIVPGVKSLNAKQAVYLQVKKALEKSVSRAEGKGVAGTGIGLYDFLTMGVGTLAGTATGNPLLGVGAVLTKKAAESPAILSSASALLEYFNTLSPTKKLLFYNFIKSATSGLVQNDKD